MKKKDVSWRLCVDYRRINTVTVKDAHPLPRIDESLDALAGSQYYFHSGHDEWLLASSIG